MKKNYFISMLGIFLAFSTMTFPLPSHATGNFGTTVKIVSYRYLLNDQLSAVSQGSGTLISDKGEVLTNAHVVMDEDLNKPYDVFSVCVIENVSSSPVCRFVANLQRYDEKIDLAILSIDGNDLMTGFSDAFPTLQFSHQYEAVDQEQVTVKGFPVTGGSTLNTTKGVVSGFETYNGYHYIKTDADIDSGNSGGTMLNKDGYFIGIPTYIVSNNDTVGRALSITDAKTWINGGKGEIGVKNQKAFDQLTLMLKTGNDALKTGSISYKEAPGLSAKAPSGWQAYQLNNKFGMIKEDGTSYFQGFIFSNGFKSTMTPEEKMKIYQDEFTDETEHEVMELNGKKVLHFWGSTADGVSHVVVMDHGSYVMVMYYFIPKTGANESQSGIDDFLASLKFSSPDVADANPLHSVNFAEYPFTLDLPSDWYVVRGRGEEGTLASAGRDNTYAESIEINYSSIPKDYDPISPAKGLDFDLKNYLPKDAEVTFKSSEVSVDGLTGWVYLYTNTSGSKKMKTISVSLLDPEYELYFEYKAEEAFFEDGFTDFIGGLRTFKSKRYDEPLKPQWNGFINMANRGIYQLPLPAKTTAPTPVNTVHLSDIAGHRYEKNIQHLVDLGVINGNPDGTFKPEEEVNRAASLKIILESLRVKQKAKGESPYVMPADFKQFPDITKGVWYETYVAEGFDKKIVAGYPDGTFKGDQHVILAEALKMALIAHSAAVWEGETTPWYKKYFDKAYDLKLLPEDLRDPAKPLTRAELAYIVDQLMQQ